MITLYHNQNSPCAAKVRAVLAEKVISWDSKIVNLVEKENLRPEYLKINPKGVVPSLIDDGKTILESTIIMEYLDTKYSPDSLKPEGAYAQAQMRKWTKWVDEILHLNWAGLAWTALIRPVWLKKSPAEIDELLAKVIDPNRRERQLRILKQGYESQEFMNSMSTLYRTLVEMEKVLAQQVWLVGGRPTLADLAVLPYIITAEKLGLDMMLDEYQGVTAWLERWRLRPAYEKAMPSKFPYEVRDEVVRYSREPWTKIKNAKQN